MLVQLSIRDIVLIDKLDLEFDRGPTILTGETGADKSILLDAFSLALGARGDGGLVRHGAAQGQVSAAFELAQDHPAVVAAKAQDIETAGSLILRRLQLAERAAHARVRGLRTVSAREQARVEKARAEADYLRHASAELTGLPGEPGEEAALAARRSTIMQAEKVAAELRDVHATVTGEYSPTPTLSAALRRLQRRQTQAPGLIAPAAEALDAALNALDLAGQALDQALRDADFDPRELGRVEERLFALRAAGRKYRVPADALASLAEKFAAELAALDAGEARLSQLTREVEAAESAYKSAARALSEARKKAAAALDAEVRP